MERKFCPSNETKHAPPLFSYRVKPAQLSLDIRGLQRFQETIPSNRHGGSAVILSEPVRNQISQGLAKCFAQLSLFCCLSYNMFAFFPENVCFPYHRGLYISTLMVYGLSRESRLLSNGRSGVIPSV